MGTRNIISLALFSAAILFCAEAYGQAHPERKHIRSGNKDYEKLDYGAGEMDYRRALEKNEASYEAMFNLADALYKQERYEEAASLLEQLTSDPTLTREQGAKVLYNLGNAQFQQDKLKEAERSYMGSLIMNPSDMEAKFNLAYVQKLLEEQGDGGSDNQDNRNNPDRQQDPGNQNQDQQEQQSEGEDPQEQSEDQGEGEGEGSEPDEPEPAENQPREGAISKDDAEQMLEAIQSQEDKTREKVNEQQKTTVGRSGKNW